MNRILTINNNYKKVYRISFIIATSSNMLVGAFAMGRHINGAENRIIARQLLLHGTYEFVPILVPYIMFYYTKGAYDKLKYTRIYL